MIQIQNFLKSAEFVLSNAGNLLSDSFDDTLQWFYSIEQKKVFFTESSFQHCKQKLIRKNFCKLEKKSANKAQGVIQCG